MHQLYFLVIGFLLGYWLCKIMPTLKHDWQHASWDVQIGIPSQRWTYYSEIHVGYL